MSEHDGPAWPGSSGFTQVLVLTRRAVLEYISDPRSVLLGMAQPIIILFLVVSAFSKLNSHTPGIPHGVSYFQFVLPAMLVDTAIQTSLQTGVALTEELRNGVVARLRSLPIRPSSILIARSLSGLIRTALQATLLLALGEATHGHISRGGLVGLVVSILLTLPIGWCLGWVFLTAGTWLRQTEAMFNLAFVATLPLLFASSAYVPVSDLPTVMAAFARVNPVTYAINAERAIFLQTAATPVSVATFVPPLVISAILGTASAFAAVRLFRRPLQMIRT